MSSLDKMWASLIALGLMVVVTLLVTFARTKTRGIVRFVLLTVAFLLFIPIFLLMIVSIF